MTIRLSATFIHLPVAVDPNALIIGTFFTSEPRNSEKVTSSSGIGDD